MYKLIQLLAENRAVPLTPIKAVVSGDSATIYIYDPIVRDPLEAEYFGGVLAKDVVQEIAGLTSPELHIRIDSPGGDVFAAQAIAQAIREYKGKVTAHVDGVAASGATVIAVACGSVVMAPGAMFMVHRAWSIAVGNMNDMLERADLLEKTDGTLAAQYASKTGEKPEAMLALMDAETWFTADEAVAAKFADSVSAVIKAEPRNWNLAAYKKAPEAKPKPAPAAEPEGVSAEHRERQGQRLKTLNRLQPTI